MIKSISLLGNYSFYQRAPAWYKTLSELGYSVKTVHEPLSLTNRSNLYHRLQTRYQFGPSLHKYTQECLSKLINYNSDLNIFLKCLPFNGKDIDQLSRRSSSYNILYNNDNMFGPLSHRPMWRKMKSAISHYDSIICYRGQCCSNYSSFGANSVYLMHSYYLPWIHFPLSSRVYKHDVCFIGHYEEDNRLSYINTILNDPSITLYIRGPGWGNTSVQSKFKDNLNIGLIGSKYSSMIRQSRIGLAFFSALNEDLYTRRVFEIPACGTFLLAPRTHVMQSIFEEDKEAVFFSTKEEMLDKIKFYLAHNTLREQIALSGYNRSIASGYDIKSRLKALLNHYSLQV